MKQDPLQKIHDNIAALADDLGDAQAQYREAKERYERLRAEFLDTGAAKVTGRRTLVNVKTRTIQRMDTRAIRKEMPPDFIDRFTTPTEQQVVNCTPL